jgi:hypothetical protein
MKIPSVLVGVSGEYFVAAELSRRGHIASISLRNTRGLDILATNQDASRSITIQVKTSQKASKDWMLSEKSESFISKTHFYVFVGLGGIMERPSFHIIPSQVVAERISTSHNPDCFSRRPRRTQRTGESASASASAKPMGASRRNEGPDAPNPAGKDA